MVSTNETYIRNFASCFSRTQQFLWKQSEGLISCSMMLFFVVFSLLFPDGRQLLNWEQRNVKAWTVVLESQLPWNVHKDLSAECHLQASAAAFHWISVWDFSVFRLREGWKFDKQKKNWNKNYYIKLKRHEFSQTSLFLNRPWWNNGKWQRRSSSVKLSTLIEFVTLLCVCVCVCVFVGVMPEGSLSSSHDVPMDEGKTCLTDILMFDLRLSASCDNTVMATY